jgi:hypothetical protein
MIAFLDFEASSLAEDSYPIEVGWVFEDGNREVHLIRPAPSWTDWDPEAENLHGISREVLLAQGRPHEVIARRVIDRLGDHDVYASAPSWDGKWLSVLFRSAGLPRHAMRLKHTRDAEREAAVAALRSAVPSEEIDQVVAAVLSNVLTPPQPDGRCAIGP